MQLEQNSKVSKSLLPRETEPPKHYMTHHQVYAKSILNDNRCTLLCNSQIGVFIKKAFFHITAAETLLFEGFPLPWHLHFYHLLSAISWLKPEKLSFTSKVLMSRTILAVIVVYTSVL